MTCEEVRAQKRAHQAQLFQLAHSTSYSAGKIIRSMFSVMQRQGAYVLFSTELIFRIRDSSLLWLCGSSETNSRAVRPNPYPAILRLTFTASIPKASGSRA